jgi:hypothetical protein
VKFVSDRLKAVALLCRAGRLHVVSRQIGCANRHRRLKSTASYCDLRDLGRCAGLSHGPAVRCAEADTKIEEGVVSRQSACCTDPPQRIGAASCSVVTSNFSIDQGGGSGGRALVGDATEVGACARDLLPFCYRTAQYEAGQGGIKALWCSIIADLPDALLRVLSPLPNSKTAASAMRRG